LIECSRRPEALVTSAALLEEIIGVLGITEARRE
jgi:hypothetical protein